MKVRVRLGEPFWRSVGSKEACLVLPQGANVNDALRALAAQFPQLEPDLWGDEIRPAVFVEEAEAEPDTPLAEGMNLTLVWPVSGGRR